MNALRNLMQAESGAGENTLPKGQRSKFIKDTGRSMRFFLNLSFASILAFTIAILFGSQPVTPVTVILALIFIITTTSFLSYLHSLKRIEQYAAKERNIGLVSRIIWEFNKSCLIRSIIGKIQTFIEEGSTSAVSGDSDYFPL